MPSPASLTCPRCAVPLHVGQAGGMTLHGCGRCGGIWLGPACAQRLADALPGEASALAARASSRAAVDADVTPIVHCPVCAQPMQRTHAAAARLDLDMCGAHGTWYDRHELERVAGAIAAQRSRWRVGAGAGAAVAGAAVAGAAVAGAAIAGAAPAPSPAKAQQGAAGIEEVAEVGVEVVAEGGAEAAVDLLGGVLSLLGSLLD
ncbi:zf-TFIIB domain-containing protein [Sorangium sp. So ce233]|uniref:TFIIB-type zinc ribbon-containing protein n=1 Tax=Sorangium sp. So ce233 TaxID=3133290 RepID=UPI003F5DB410